MLVESEAQSATGEALYLLVTLIGLLNLNVTSHPLLWTVLQLIFLLHCTPYTS